MQAPATSSFHPPGRILLGPGPSDVHQRVLDAMARPTIGHLDPRFTELLEDLKELLRYAFQTSNELTFALSAPGMIGMETCFVNLVEPGDKVVVCSNGVFGRRMIENVLRCRGELVVIEDDWGKPVDPQKLEDALIANRDTKIVAFVHAETSTGAQSDARLLAEIAHGYGALVICDTVTSLGCTPVLVDEWGLDAAYSASQKGLSCTPGLSPVTFGERAIARIKARKEKVQSWFMDLGLVMSYWGGSDKAVKRTYHHTAPINALYGLHESLVMLAEEGLETRWERHRKMHHSLVAGLEKLGLELLVAPPDRLPQLNTVLVPEGMDEARLRTDLLNLHGIEIGAGLGELAGKTVRIGLMGTSATPGNVASCLGALEAVLALQNWRV
jgi:alanine-glyoxylate transaminase/serine-glyoxylate transaminase/serine-pyruvate transaminase